VKVLICSYSDSEGGAARAAFKHFQALITFGIDAEFWSTKYRFNKEGMYYKASGFKVVKNFMKRQIARLIIRLFARNDGQFRSLNLFSAINIHDINQSNFDLVNLHWVCGEFLSVSDIASSKKPIVWTLHDMWMFLGTEHYQGKGVANLGQIKEDPYIHASSSWFERWAWSRKKRLWVKPIPMVLSSKWMLDKVRASHLVGSWPSCIIPNAIDLTFFVEQDMVLSRKKLNLPLDKKIVLFGAAGGLGDFRKGGDILLEAMRQVIDLIPDAHLVVFGGVDDSPITVANNKFPVTNLGPIRDADLLLSLYSAADVLAVPSREDNLPLTAVEAHGCSCPIVAFEIAGLKDIVDQGVTGYLVPAFDAQAFGLAITKILGVHKDEILQMRFNSRLRAEKLWSNDSVVPLYMNAYQNAINSWRITN